MIENLPAANHRLEGKPSLQEFMEVLSYEPSTGIFRWKVRMNKNGVATCGVVAGNKRQDGYIRITFRKREYAAHRLAWFFEHGSWPKDVIDHINGIPDDNRIENLRDVTKNINQHNRGMDVRNRSGCSGVGWCIRNRAWRVRIQAGGNRRFIGLYKEKSDAVSAYLEAKKRLHPMAARWDELVSERASYD